MCAGIPACTGGRHFLGMANPVPQPNQGAAEGCSCQSPGEQAGIWNGVSFTSLVHCEERGSPIGTPNFAFLPQVDNRCKIVPFLTMLLHPSKRSISKYLNGCHPTSQRCPLFPHDGSFLTSEFPQALQECWASVPAHWLSGHAQGTSPATPLPRRIESRRASSWACEIDSTWDVLNTIAGPWPSENSR